MHNNTCDESNPEIPQNYGIENSKDGFLPYRISSEKLQPLYFKDDLNNNCIFSTFNEALEAIKTHRMVINMIIIGAEDAEKWHALHKPVPRPTLGKIRVLD